MLRLRNFTLIILAVSPLLELNAAIVDTFEFPTTDQTIISSGNGFSSTTQGGLPTTEVVGGSRFFSVSSTITKNNTNASIAATMNGIDPDPSFDVSYDRPDNGNNFFTGTSQIIWGYTTDLNLDIGTDTDFLLTLQDINLSPLSLMNASLQLTLETGSGTDSVLLPLLNGGFLQPEYRFAGFTGVDFSDIDRIILTLTATQDRNSSNFTISYGAFSSAAPLPEPGSCLLIGLTACGAFIVSRRRRNRDAS